MILKEDAVHHEIHARLEILDVLVGLYQSPRNRGAWDGVRLPPQIWRKQILLLQKAPDNSYFPPPLPDFQTFLRPLSHENFFRTVRVILAVKITSTTFIQLKKCFREVPLCCDHQDTTKLTSASASANMWRNQNKICYGCKIDVGMRQFLSISKISKVTPLEKISLADLMVPHLLLTMVKVMRKREW